MTKTANDVVTRALKNLKIIGAGETADGDDYSDAYDEYLVFHEYLQKENRRLYRASRGSWSSNAVPDEVWTRVSDLLAEELLGTFPVSAETDAKVREKARNSGARLNAYLSVYSRDRSRFPSDLAGRYNTGRFGAYR